MVGAPTHRMIVEAQDDFDDLIAASAVARREGLRVWEVANLALARQNLEWQAKAECALGHDGPAHAQMARDLAALDRGIETRMQAAFVALLD